MTLKQSRQQVSAIRNLLKVVDEKERIETLRVWLQEAIKVKHGLELRR